MSTMFILCLNQTTVFACSCNQSLKLAFSPVVKQIYFTVQTNKLSFVSCLSPNFTEIIRYVENKLKENRTTFDKNCSNTLINYYQIN